LGKKKLFKLYMEIAKRRGGCVITEKRKRGGCCKLTDQKKEKEERGQVERGHMPGY